MMNRVKRFGHIAWHGLAGLSALLLVVTAYRVLFASDKEGYWRTDSGWHVEMISRESYEAWYWSRDASWDHGIVINHYCVIFTCLVLLMVWFISSFWARSSSQKSAKT